MSDLEELPELLIELRGLVVLAHTAIRDLRAAVRDAAQVTDNLPQAVDRRLSAAVKDGLQKYEADLSKAIADGTQAAYDRFDILTAICLGEDPQSVRAGKKSIPDLLRRYIETNGLPWQLVPLEDQDVPEAFRKPEKS